jgi:hypothetical protein
MVGVLVGYLGKFLCIPLEGRVHEGIGPFQDRQLMPTQAETPVSLMARQLLDKARQIGRPCYAVLDAYFAVKTSFLIFAGAVNDVGRRWVHLITRAKANYVASWKHPEEHHNPSCKWEKVHLADLFDRPETFDEARIVIQSKIKNIRYTYLDMLWKPVNDWLRFVWVIDGTGRYILMCSELTLHPEIIIQIYCCRWSIEVMFLALKHLIGGFGYRFWTKHFPKLERGQTLASVQLSEIQIARCFQTVCAIERFVNLAGIALGLLQYLSDETDRYLESLRRLVAHAIF